MFLAIVLGLGTGGAGAQTLTWALAGSGFWDTASANWSGDATTFVSDGTQNVVFSTASNATITISPGMNPASVTASPSGGTLQFNNGPIAGSGVLTKSSGGTLRIETDNTYTGGTVINGGTLRTGLQKDDALGTGPVTLNDGTIFLWRGDHPNPLTVNGGKILAENGFNDSGWSGTVNLLSDLEVQANYNMTFSGPIGGPGGSDQDRRQDGRVCASGGGDCDAVHGNLKLSRK